MVKYLGMTKYPKVQVNKVVNCKVTTNVRELCCTEVGFNSEAAPVWVLRHSKVPVVSLAALRCSKV